MPTAITAGHIQAPEKYTAKLWWTPDGDAGGFEIPNILDYREAHEVNTVRRMVAETGSRRVNLEQPDVIAFAWEFTFDERPSEVAAILASGTLGSTVQQATASAPAGTATISTVKTGRWHAIGAYNLDTVVATIDAVTLVEGTDYDVDLASGMIYFYATADVADGDSCGLTFGNQAIDFEKVTAGDSPHNYGAGILHEFSPWSPNQPAKITTFNGFLIPMEWPTQSGEVGQFKLKATASSKPVIQRASAA